MEISKETENQIKELQILEHNLQAMLMQKQALQAELSEIDNALSELIASSEIYKIAGSIMIKSSKESLTKELETKKELINLRLKSIEHQEKSLEKDSESLRQKVLSKIKS